MAILLISFKIIVLIEMTTNIPFTIGYLNTKSWISQEKCLLQEEIQFQSRIPNIICCAASSLDIILCDRGSNNQNLSNIKLLLAAS